MTVHDLTSSGLPIGCVGFRVPRGRVVWTDADYPDGADGRFVIISRLEPMPGMKLRVFSRRVAPETEAAPVKKSLPAAGAGTSSTGGES